MRSWLPRSWRPTLSFSNWAAAGLKIPNVGFLGALAAIIVIGIVGCIPGILLDRVPTGGLGRTVVVLLLQIVLSFGLHGSLLREC